MIIKRPVETKIKIVDSLMGSGKTSWAIQYMNQAPVDKKFIYITPFNNEVERIINSVGRDFFQPEKVKGKKLNGLKLLTSNGKNIVATHELFKRMDKELIELIEMQRYTLILDEVLDVIEQVDITKNDIQVLLNAKTQSKEQLISINDKGYVKWNEDDYSDGRFTDIRNIARANNLMIYENTSMYRLFPVSVFQAFEEVFVLTYMFNGQLQRYYFDLFNLQYKFYSVGSVNNKYTLVDYIPLRKENRQHLKELMNIHYPKRTDKKDLNSIGEGRYTLSKKNLGKLCAIEDQRKVLQANAFNYYHNKLKVPTDEVMWTTFKDYEKKLCPKNLKKQFVEVTARATNDYANKSTCIYIANRYMNPITERFFTSKGVKVDEDLFALSELLQWIFRSRIRKGQPINLYIPSKRMRTLLEKYLENQDISY